MANEPTVTKVTSECESTDKDNEHDILKMLEEQNRLLEQDSRYTQKIKRTESNASNIASVTEQPPTTPLSSPPGPGTSVPPVSEQQEGSDSTVPSINEEPNEEESLLRMWAELLKNWEENVKKNSKLIKQLVRQGIPNPLRGMAWQLLSGPHDEGLKKKYPLLITEEACPFEKQIRRDLDRTFPDHSFFKDRDGDGQESLLSVMKAYSLYDREVGYCQGSLFLAGQLLMHMPEEETFCVFVNLMNKYKLRELYKPSMAKLSICFYQMENLVEELFPKLNIHFKALGFYTSMYSSSWFLTLFASTLSLNISFRVMDVFLEEGLETVFRVGLALMEHSHDELMSMDLEEMTKLFQKGVKSIHESDPDALLDKAFKIKLSSKKLKKLEKEYLLKKEKQATENSNLILLRDENENLEKRVMALEIECAALADRLIQGQVTRAQEAEELFITRREVSRLRKQVKNLQEEQVNKSGDSNISGDYSLSPVSRPPHPDGELRDRSISTPSLREGSSPSLLPTGSINTPNVSREEAQQCLREMGISPTTTPTAKPPTPDLQLQSVEADTILRELATTKIQYAETLHTLELKSLELRGALQRENDVREKLEQAREQIKSLQNAEEQTDTPTICPRCGHGLTYTSSKISLNSSKNCDEEEECGSSCPSEENTPDNSNNITNSTVNNETLVRAPPSATPIPDLLNNGVATTTTSKADDT